MSPYRLLLLVLVSLAIAASAHADEADCSGVYRTQTQGGWGADAGGDNPGSYRDAHFDGAFPTGLVIGGGAAAIAGPTVLLTSSDAVRVFLPQEGTPGALGADATDPTTTAAGVLAGQAVALTLSIGFDAVDPGFGTGCIGLESLEVVDPGSTCFGWTVAEALEEANRVLAGESGVLTASEVNDCLAKINQNFVDGKTDNGGLALGAPGSGDFVTYDQDAWGQAAAEGPAGAYRDAHFAAAFPTGAAVGASALDIPGFSAVFQSAAAVEAFLPQAGPPAPLGANAVDPLTTDAGSLAGHTLALALNVGFDAFDPDFSPSCVSLADLVVAESSSPCVGWSVQHVLDQAHAILAGATATVTAEEIDGCVAAVNADFLGGTVSGGFLTYPGACVVEIEADLVEDAQFSLNFQRSGRDKFKLKGALALPLGFETLGSTASCEVGGVRLDFLLDGRGRGKTSEGMLKLRYQKRQATWNYSCKGKKGSWSDDWVDDGLVDANLKDVPAAVPVSVEAGGFKKSGLAPVGYSAKAGSKGKAK